MATYMDNDFREKIKQKIVRLAGGPRIAKEPYLTEAMDTSIRAIAEHKAWTWMKVGPIGDSIVEDQDSWPLPDYIDEFSDMTVIIGFPLVSGSSNCLEYIDLAEYARRRTAPGATDKGNEFDAYTICERELRFIHPGAGGVIPTLQFWGSLSPSQLDDIEDEVTGVRNIMPKNFDNCLGYGTLAELLGSEAGAKWSEKFDKELNRLGLLDDKSPDKITYSGGTK
jgi:hypothetical protein